MVLILPRELSGGRDRVARPARAFRPVSIAGETSQLRPKAEVAWDYQKGDAPVTVAVKP
jgi:hypothetical protein